MMRFDEDTARRKKEDLSLLLKSLVTKGNFGEGEYLSDEPDNDNNEAFQFASVIQFGNLVLKLRNGQTSNIPIVTKYQIPDEGGRNSRDSATMFHNEVKMYKEVLPFLDVNNSKLYPKMYYGIATRGADYNKDILILENISKSGFKLASSKCFLDYAHIKIAMENIAKLHSWSYTAKSLEPSTFSIIKSKLFKLDMKPDENFDFEKANFLAMERAVQPLIDKGIEEQTLRAFLEIIKIGVDKIRAFIWEPKEPFGAIIHGDFCKNNLFYRYNSSGEPVDCAFFDFQMSRYACPVVDLSFFLYMHTDKTLRDQHWDEFLDIYWTSVRKNVPNDIPLPSKDEFLDYFASKAVYGLFPSSFFLKVMLHEEPLEMDKWAEVPKEQKTQAFVLMGGAKGQQAVEDVVSHLNERKYIHTFNSYYNANASTSSVPKDVS